MDPPKTIRRIVRKKLCLKSTLSKYQYDPIADVYFYDDVVTTSSSKQATKPPQAVEDLDDFKSPKKIATKAKSTVVRRRLRMPSRPYSYPEGCSSTQDMMVYGWRRAREKYPAYLSEDEFEIFKDERMREAELQSRAEFRNQLTSAVIDENSIQQMEKLNSIEAKHDVPLEPTISDTNGCSIDSGRGKTSVESSGQGVTHAENPVTSPPILQHTHFSPPHNTSSSKYNNGSTDSLRSDLRKIKIENVIIADSDVSEDEVVSSQLPGSEKSEKLKSSVEKSSNQSEMFGNSNDLKSSEEVFCITEPISIQERVASKSPIIVSIPLNVLYSYQAIDIKKSNVEKDMVTLPEADQLEKKQTEFIGKTTPSLQDIQFHPTQNASPSVKFPLGPSIEKSAKSEWRVEKLSSAFKPSQQNSKSSYCKKFRFSCIRSLRWKTKILKRKHVINSI